MENRNFGGTGLKVSPITFGAWSIGGPAVISGKQVGWTGVTDEESILALEHAFYCGINTFDTADSYARGHSEELVGRALAGKRKDAVISTKVGIVEGKEDKFTLDFSRKHILDSCEGSLKRLRTDYIDIYLLHMVVDGYPLTEEIKETLELLKNQGKIRHYGVSAQFPGQGMEQLQMNFGDCMMIEYNMLASPGTEAVINEAHKRGVGVITRGALGKGLFTGKYKKGQRFAANDVRSRLQQDYIDLVADRIEQLNHYAAETGLSLLSIALAFHIRQQGIGTIAVGLKNRGQVEEIVREVPSAADLEKYNWSEILNIFKA